MKYFNVETIEEVLEYNSSFNILRSETLSTFRDDAEDAIQRRHLMRLKTCKSLEDRTRSSKLRWEELEKMAIEFRFLSDRYY